MNAIHFKTPAEFRQWFETHHATAKELQVRFYKKASGKGGMTYAEAVDEALCFGWIDSVVHRLDDESYAQRFTPRKPGSNWSNINVGHIARLKQAGRMHAAGLAAFAARSPAKTGVYSFESKTEPKLSAKDAKTFRADKKAWAFFSAQPPGYRRLSLWHIVSAKQEATRARRLNTLIVASAAGRRLA